MFNRIKSEIAENKSKYAKAVTAGLAVGAMGALVYKTRIPAETMAKVAELQAAASDNVLYVADRTGEIMKITHEAVNS